MIPTSAPVRLSIASLVLDRPQRTLRRWCEAGVIPATRVGSRWYVSGAWLFADALEACPCCGRARLADSRSEPASTGLAPAPLARIVGA